MKDQMHCRRVAEKGIDALEKQMEDLEAMEDNPPAPEATISAWRKLQINTSVQLSQLYRELGREAEAGSKDADAQVRRLGATH
jgi:hypothetical protein